MPIPTTQEVKRSIGKVLQKYPSITKAYLFGSRARGTGKSYSDVDLALDGTITIEVLLRVKGDLEEETALPFHFDVVSFPRVKQTLLGKKITAEGKIIFQR